MPDMGITETSLELFLAYARDASNWSGTPLIGGNVPTGRAERGNLTQLKRADLLKTFEWDRDVWVKFTAAGRELAGEHGVELRSEWCS